MTGADEAACSDGSDRVLVVAPFRRDAAVLQAMLQESGLAARICGTPVELGQELAAGCGVVLLSQEGLTSRVVDELSGWLSEQPRWSEPPLVLLLDRELHDRNALAELKRRLPSSKLVVLQRPVRRLELATAVQTVVVARRRQFQIRDHIQWQEELQSELNHRVKNVLANVSAIYHMTMRQSGSLQAFAESFEGRLTALSRVHSAVVVPDQPRSLQEIAELVLAPYESDGDGRVRVQGPTLHISPESAVTLALCLHELATNAAKYGALSSPTGRVKLEWTIEGHPLQLDLAWTETGGPVVAPPTRRGYGSAFVRSAARGGLGGSFDIDYRAEGVIARFRLPVQKLATAEHTYAA